MTAAVVVAVRDLVKRYGAQTVLESCSLDAIEGEILTLLGPSGCGKTTLLRCIAGFIRPDGGGILIDGADTLPVPVNRRPVGVVFQSYALFPHLTVAGNVGYGLRMRGSRKTRSSGASPRRWRASRSVVSRTAIRASSPAASSSASPSRV